MLISATVLTGASGQIHVPGSSSAGDSLLLTEACVNSAGRPDPTKGDIPLSTQVGCRVKVFQKLLFRSLAENPGVSTGMKVSSFVLGFSEF